MTQLFITCPPYLEQLLAEELQELGIPARALRRGVSAPLTMDNVYIINYASHLATRVLWPLASFTCFNKEMLYENIKQLDWTQYFLASQTFAVDTNLLSTTYFNHSHFASLVVKDAICDLFREKQGVRPSIQTLNPDIPIHLAIDGSQATIYLDTSGPPLFKRGYRQTTFEGSLQETLACAILRWCDYSAEDILCDPYCGSGTFLWEASFLATKTPAGFFRDKYAFFHHPFFSEKQWSAIKIKLNSRIDVLQHYRIFGGDRNLKAIEHCRQIQKKVQFPLYFQHTLIQNLIPPQSPSLVIANPPYGKRLKVISDPYVELKNFFSRSCDSNMRAAILTPYPTVSSLSSGIYRTKQLINGGLPVYVHFWKPNR